MLVGTGAIAFLRVTGAWAILAVFGTRAARACVFTFYARSQTAESEGAAAVTIAIAVLAALGTTPRTAPRLTFAADIEATCALPMLVGTGAIVFLRVTGAWAILTVLGTRAACACAFTCDARS